MTETYTKRYECELAVKTAIETVPRIVRAANNARSLDQPISWRKAQLTEAIAQTRFLLGELVLRRARLGWEERQQGQKGDAA